MSEEFTTKVPISASKRLRQVLYLLYIKEVHLIGFEDYYSIKMEEFIESIKIKLNEKGKES